MQTVGTPFLWGSFTMVVLTMLIIDLFLRGREHGTQTISFKQSTIWSLIWVSVTLLFSGVFWWYTESKVGYSIATTQTLAFLTGYILEKALAVDNVFVWLMFFNYFSIPASLQRRVLIYGVLGAIVLRTIMILAGNWLVMRFSWILYLFGMFLLLTGLKMIFNKEKHKKKMGYKIVVSWLSKHLNITNTLEGENFFILKNGVIFATPLFLVLVIIELSDVIFALDSIPAIFAVTTNSFIVLTSNLFAILGLRAMYFLLANVAERFFMLKYGLAIVLVFIGIKMLIAKIYHIPVAISLSIVSTILSSTIFINAWVNQKNNKK
ncbi:TerC/Alx family metal homeostasis membrane protein [Pantoea sp. Nvir]|uniref:TerC/Alx family metal homeostasis membrane protein n=1 Tax=Pantoea sp. Nvir TaxID=2576760 RepID=UPI0013582AE1|nr:TerC/Alx family metal homeostasis membrane protein [Pantoea sp. Nvir]MXP66788.1 TerC/Alx family metal homeostasis membrane protein [Pantoea sp. Nvir]CAJ0990834.1 Putative membrane-bound redox modulator Alx [Pantoea sp. Nvir]